MKILLISIMTGKYMVFFDTFMKNINNFFDGEVDIAIFSDAPKTHKYLNLSFHYVDALPWPYNSLNRFDYFNTLKNIDQNYDYVFFFQSNAFFYKSIGKNDFAFDSDFILFEHPKINSMRRFRRPYERSFESTASVSYCREPEFYFQACAFGIRSSVFYEFCSTISNMIKTDLGKGIIALWHDESYLNKYMINKRFEMKSSDYIYPEGLRTSFLKPKVIMFDKSIFFNVESFKGRSGRRFIFRLLRVLNDYFGMIQSRFQHLEDNN